MAGTISPMRIPDTHGAQEPWIASIIATSGQLGDGKPQVGSDSRGFYDF